MKITNIVGRAALAVMFVHGGLAAARKPGKRVKLLQNVDIPYPDLSVRANGVLMTVAGGRLALGLAPRADAAVLSGLLIPTTLVGHPFWREEGEARAGQKIQSFENLAMLGELLLTMADDESQQNSPQ